MNKKFEKSSRRKCHISDILISLARFFINIHVKEKVHLFNKTIKNIIANYICYGTITYNDRDLPRISKWIEELIYEKTHANKFYLQNKNNSFCLSPIQIPGDFKIALVYVKNVFNRKIPFISPLFHEDKFKFEVMAF